MRERETPCWLRRPVLVKLKSFDDLVRLAASTVVNGQAMDLFHYEENGKHYYMMQGCWPDYYGLQGLPLLYLAEGPKPESGYLRVRINGGLSYSWAETEGADVPIPVISLVEKPFFLELPERPAQP